MTGHISFCLLLFLTGCCDCTLPRTISPVFHDDAARYCRICADHTMCQFPTTERSERCRDLENDELDVTDVKAILRFHNEYRDRIAMGLEERGNPGPQPAARYMMELIWDEELARVARRWAIQCNLSEKDHCRDVERFGVWQNVHVLDVDSVGSSTSAGRIHFHIESWYDEVEGLDCAEVGRLGCGRAVYRVPEKSKDSKERSVLDGLEASSQPDATTPPGPGRRVEALVCNYGPLDRGTPKELYESGEPGLCPAGTIRSTRYRALCQRERQRNSTKTRLVLLEKFQRRSFGRKVQRRMQDGVEQEVVVDEEAEEETETKRETSRGTGLRIARAVYLGQLLSLLRLSI